jgi:hypothetical protein
LSCSEPVHSTILLLHMYVRKTLTACLWLQSRGSTVDASHGLSVKSNDSVNSDGATASLTLRIDADQTCVEKLDVDGVCMFLAGKHLVSTCTVPSLHLCAFGFRKDLRKRVRFLNTLMHARPCLGAHICSDRTHVRGASVPPSIVVFAQIAHKSAMPTYIHTYILCI